MDSRRPTRHSTPSRPTRPSRRDGPSTSRRGPSAVRRPDGPSPRPRGRSEEPEERARPIPAAPSPLTLAASVIRQANEKRPADAVLRDTLKAAKGLTADQAAGTAQLVFAYYRWRGFVGRSLPLPRQIEIARDYARRFAEAPESFGDEGWDRAVPAWTREQVDVSTAWLRSLQGEPHLWLRARPGTSGALALELGDCQALRPDLLPEALVYQGPHDLFRQPAFHAGRFELQDFASQIVGAICAPRAGENWWDACAGEGGKTLHLADQMDNRGVVWATDRASWRLDRLRLRANRAQLYNVRWSAWDGTGAPPIQGRLHGVLLDAPCTGLGTWQRNPHARWTTRPEDVTELAALQLRLLRATAARLGPGGRLVYSVCTLTHAETTGVADAFAAAEPAFEPVPIPGPWRPVDAPGPAHHLWVWPQDHASNGMFVAQWRRRG